MFSYPEWDVLDESRLPAVLEVLIANHPDPEYLQKCRPGINLREVDGDRFEAYVIDDIGLPYILGRFPRTMLLRKDVGHPAAMN